jgi:D-sedoheptulose 7-phosphate isomerase
MTPAEQARANFEEARKSLDTFLSDEENFKKISDAAGLMVSAIQKGGKVISCGNGGSMSDAMHFAEELSGRFRDDRKALPAVSISDPTHLSCVANDYGYEFVFSRYVEALGHEGDVLLAISTSGKSANVLKAIQAARAKKMKVVGLTGKDGGSMATICDVEIRAPFSKYADRAQEVHIKIIHSLIQLIESQVTS